MHHETKDSRSPRLRAITFTAAVLLQTSTISQPAAAVDDVLLQTMGGKIVIGIVDDNSLAGTLGQRVFRDQFLSNFRSANPGFVALPTGSPNMPPGAAGFPANHDVRFDLLPMTIGQVASNLWFWDGADLDGNGVDLSDVNFAVPAGIVWEVFDADFNVFAAAGTNQLVPGGLIQRTSADIDPNDGIDTGSIHKHLVLQLRNAGSPGMPPAAGVYVTAWQARSAGFETSDPFFFVHRTSSASNAVRNLAADWITENIEMLLAPPGLPGDFNGDDVVDAADYIVWRKKNGTPEEYETWRSNFGMTVAGDGSHSDLPSGAAAVPEASSLLSALLAACCYALSRKRAAAT